MNYASWIKGFSFLTLIYNRLEDFFFFLILFFGDYIKSNVNTYIYIYIWIKINTYNCTNKYYKKLKKWDRLKKRVIIFITSLTIYIPRSSYNEIRRYLKGAGDRRGRVGLKFRRMHLNNLWNPNPLSLPLLNVPFPKQIPTRKIGIWIIQLIDYKKRTNFCHSCRSDLWLFY